MSRMLTVCSSLTLLVALLPNGCATTSAVKLGSESGRAPIPWEQVVVYRTAEQVPRKYDEVALLHGTGNWSSSGEGTVYNSMRKKAGAMGANGIIIEAMTDPGAGAKVVSALFGVGGAERKGKAIAIYVHAALDSTVSGSQD